jgi:hypothetical protein
MVFSSLRCSHRTVFTVACLLLAAAGAAQAQLIITAAGTAQGLSLSTFATGFPNPASVGPLGVAFPKSGGVLVSDDPGNVRLFPTDTDGQNAAAVPVAQTYGGANAADIVQVGGNIYMTRQSVGDVVQINNSGTFNQVIVAGVPAATGMVANPANGHLFVSTISDGVIFDVDPVAKTKTVFINLAADGLTISPDGKTLYAAVNSSGHILGFNTATKAQVFDSGFINGGVDGTALGGGIFGNDIFVNTNGGQVFEVNLTSDASTLIATGGSRGDFVIPDLLNGTLLVTQSDRIDRINGIVLAGPGPGSGSPVPEPSAIAFVTALGASGSLLVFRRFRRSR